MTDVSFPVVLDACVLVPMTLCDALLSLADRGLYRPLWSDKILDEMERNVAKMMIHRGTHSQEKAEAGANYRRLQMEQAYPEASVKGYESLIRTMTNHPKDRHVLAAAKRGNALIIVTNNIRDFPRSALRPYDIERKTADQFLNDLLGLDPELVVSVIKDMAALKKKPPLT